MTVQVGAGLLEVADSAALVVDGARATVVLDASAERLEQADVGLTTRARMRSRGTGRTARCPPSRPMAGGSASS